MFRFAFASVLATAEAGTLAITWKDCGAKHATVTDVQPTSIHTGATETLTGTGTVDEDVTSAHFTATVSALGAKLTDCDGDATTDIVCTLPMGVGKITVKAVPFPLKAGSVSIPVEVQTSSVIPPSLANVDVHIAAVDQNGEDTICLDVHTAAQRQYPFEPTPAPPCSCDWAEKQGCEHISDDGGLCYAFCCGDSPDPTPAPYDCTWAEEQGCEHISDDGSPAYAFCCGGSPDPTPAPIDCKWAAAGCQYFDDDGSVAYKFCCGETTKPPVLAFDPTPLAFDPTPAPPCSCDWAEKQGCEHISDDGSLCYAFCCGDSPDPTPAPYDCTWAEEQGCENISDDGSPAYAFCCGGSPDPTPAPIDCKWAAAGCQYFDDDGSVAYKFCCGETTKPPVLAFDPTPAPPCSCDWAEKQGCEHISDDGSLCYAFCCGDSPDPTPAPYDCTWAEEQGCENISDDGSPAYAFCCGGSPDPTPAPIDCKWAAAGCQYFDDDGSAAYKFCCGTSSPAPQFV